MPDQEKLYDKYKYLILLSHFPKFGAKRLKALERFFSDWESAYFASAGDLCKAGLNEALAQEFSVFRSSQDWQKLEAILNRESILVSTPTEDDYPPLLKEIYDPPCLLYYKGRLELKKEFPLAVVGTRKISQYGRQAVEDIVFKLSQQGFAIVSGLALGTDSLAHAQAIKNRSKTIAVLGTGIDSQSIYPSSNRYLAQRILEENGALVSEFPLSTPPLKQNFPQRNRIISGLSLGTLVIEAGERSGALITARFSLEQNREVFAVPGSIYSPVSAGPNRLLKEGAQLTASAQDIIEALNLSDLENIAIAKESLPESPEEANILKHLSREPVHINNLIRLTNLTTSAINSTLILMEMKGMVKNVGGMKYIKARS